MIAVFVPDGQADENVVLLNRDHSFCQGLFTSDDFLGGS